MIRSLRFVTFTGPVTTRRRDFSRPGPTRYPVTFTDPMRYIPSATFIHSGGGDFVVVTFTFHLYVTLHCSICYVTTFTHGAGRYHVAISIRYDVYRCDSHWNPHSPTTLLPTLPRYIRLIYVTILLHFDTVVVYDVVVGYRRYGTFTIYDLLIYSNSLRYVR